PRLRFADRPTVHQQRGVRSGDAVRCKIARFGKRNWQSCTIVPDSIMVNFREEVHYMKRSSVLFYLLVLCVATGAGALLVQGQGRGQSPEAQARQKQQLDLEAATPKLQITEEVLPLVIPGHTIGETEGVSKNSKGHLFVYSRTGMGGSSRGGTAAELFEF